MHTCIQIIIQIYIGNHGGDLDNDGNIDNSNSNYNNGNVGDGPIFEYAAPIPFTCMAFDGHTAVLGSSGGQIFVWDMIAFQKINVIDTTHCKCICSVWCTNLCMYVCLFVCLVCVWISI